MTDAERERLIAECALIADEAALEVRAIMKSAEARTSQYDRQTKIKLEYAARWCSRIGRRIRALTNEAEGAIPINGSNLTRAVALLRELRPATEGAMDSHWRATMLVKIDALLHATGESAPD